MYYLLTERFKNCEERLVALIRETVNTERIYLLGSELSTRRSESVFVPEAPLCKYVSRYYLLVLINGNEDVNTIAETIENKAKQLVPVTAIVLPTATFTAWLKAGHPFAYTVYKKAVQLLRPGEEEIITRSDFLKTLVCRGFHFYKLPVLFVLNLFINCFINGNTSGIQIGFKLTFLGG